MYDCLNSHLLENHNTYVYFSKHYLHVPPVNLKFIQQQNNSADCGISYIIPATTLTV